jgi:DsbC/DsbD-like thiol-disulfide interchange protein
MKRRHVLAAPFFIATTAKLWAAEPPWSARLLQGGFDGKNVWAGLAISLAPKWKTYWRVPGDGGIAPQLDFVTENVATNIVHYPLPSRFQDEAGMTIGYKEEVVFPLSFQPFDVAKPVKVSLKSFFGVCDVVCIPAQFSGDLTFEPAKSAESDQAVISQWQSKVPILSVEGPIVKATTTTENGKPHLVLDLLNPVDDIFVEGNPAHYFGKPSTASGLVALPVSGANAAEELKGNALRITTSANGKGLEQKVVVV